MFLSNTYNYHDYSSYLFLLFMVFSPCSLEAKSSICFLNREDSKYKFVYLFLFVCLFEFLFHAESFLKNAY